MSSNLDERKVAVDHLKRLIAFASSLGVDTVCTFIGRIQSKSVEDNLLELKSVWSPILDTAEKYKVNIAIENCPMLFGQEQWPGGQNLFTSPKLWSDIFSILDSKRLGINYDPSHFVWQGIDYLEPISEFKEKIFHVHFKDIKLLKNRMKRVGSMAYPLEYMAPKLPGFGDVDWSKFVGALRDIGYDGYTCIEIEDKTFEKNEEDILKALKLSYDYMRQFVI